MAGPHLETQTLWYVVVIDRLQQNTCLRDDHCTFEETQQRNSNSPMNGMMILQIGNTVQRWA